MYDITESYTVGFLILICITFIAFSLMLAIYTIERLRKKKAKRDSITIAVQLQQADTKC